MFGGSYECKEEVSSHVKTEKKCLSKASALSKCDVCTLMFTASSITQVHSISKISLKYNKF